MKPHSVAIVGAAERIKGEAVQEGVVGAHREQRKIEEPREAAAAVVITSDLVPVLTAPLTQVHRGIKRGADGVDAHA